MKCRNRVIVFKINIFIYMGIYLTTQEFINRAERVHNNKYNYSLVEYENSKTKVKIICDKH